MSFWGKIVSVTDTTHVSCTNEDSHEGPGFHSTTEVEGVKVRDYVTADGDHGRTTVSSQNSTLWNSNEVSNNRSQDAPPSYSTDMSNQTPPNTWGWNNNENQ